MGLFLGYGNGSLSQEPVYSIISLSQSIVVGDLNNDNKLDLVFEDFQTSSVRVHLGLGNGSFQDQAVYSIGDNPNSVTLGDFNNDTRLDIAVTDIFENVVRIIFWYGNGSFGKQIVYLTEANPHALVPGDFNNDGRLDLIVGNMGSLSLSVFLGYRNQAFEKQTTLITGTGSRPRSFAVGDFNKDTQLDIAVTNFGTDNFIIFIGHGNYSFTNEATLATKSDPISIAVADFNNDTLLDIVVANFGDDTVSVYLGCGNGSLLTPKMFKTGYKSEPNYVAVGDFNNDTLPDIIVANYGTNMVGILIGHNHGSFAPLKVSSFDYGSHPLLVSIGDFNQDELLDFVVVNEGTDNLKLLLQTC